MTTLSFVAGMDDLGRPALFKRAGDSGAWEIEHVHGSVGGDVFKEVYAFDADNIVAIGHNFLSVKQAGVWVDDDFTGGNYAFVDVYMPTATRVLVCGQDTSDGYGRVWEWGVGMLIESLSGIYERLCTTIHGIGENNIWVGTEESPAP